MLAHTGPVPVAPCDFVVFGGTGDLAVRKLLPALYLRDRDGQLPAETRIVAVSRAGLDDDGYRDKIRGELPRFVGAPELDDETVQRFVARLSHVSLDIDDNDSWPPLVDTLRDGERIRVFYLAIAPALFGPVSRRLAEHGLVTETSRLVLEKPIGHDLASAREVNDAVGAVFAEQQIFRIDHYLGKESVQNLLVTRFANTFLEPLWNANCIDHVQITASESLGVGSRGGYYDTSGALRDMVQNHLLQLLCLVAMEPPTYVDRETVRDEKLKVLQALRPLEGADVDRCVVAGQYSPGLVDGIAAPSYREDAERPDSTTETFVAIKAEVANWRWAGVPFYLRTGKRMDRRCSEIVIQFKDVPHPMFPGSEGAQEPNRPTDHRIDARGGGALFDVGVYCFGPAVLLAPREPLAVAATAVRNENGIDVSMSGWLDIGEGFAATAEVSFESVDRRSLDLVGTRGAIRIPFGSAPGPAEPSVLTVERSGGEVSEHSVAGADAYAEMLDQFANVVQVGATPRWGAEESRRLARWLDALHTAAR